jgi:hypothetical protein
MNINNYLYAGLFRVLVLWAARLGALFMACINVSERLGRGDGLGIDQCFWAASWVKTEGRRCVSA